MRQNKAARFDLSQVPQELRKPALEHLLAYRTFKDKETAHRKLRHQMVNDFRPKESIFPDDTVTIKHVVDEDLQKALHQNECELRLQFHQKDFDAAQDKHRATHKGFNEVMKSYYDAYTSLSTDYKVDLTEVDTQDALMDLGDGNNFHPIVDVMMTTARQHVQHTVEAMVMARRCIYLEAEAKHAKYLEHFDKKLIERATRVQNERVREEVNKAMAADAIVQGQAEQIKILTEAVRQLMVDNKQQHAKNGWSNDVVVEPTATKASVGVQRSVATRHLPHPTRLVPEHLAQGPIHHATPEATRGTTLLNQELLAATHLVENGRRRRRPARNAQASVAKAMTAPKKGEAHECT